MEQVIELLEVIVKNTSSSNSVWIAAVSATSAVAGAGISAVLTYLATGRSIKSQERIERERMGLEQVRLRASVVVTERLRWLQELRATLAGVYCKMDLQYYCIKQAIEAPGDKELQNKIDGYSESITEQINLLHLMMNAEVKTQKELANSLQYALQYLLKLSADEELKADDEHYGDLKQQVFQTASEVSSETWKQIQQFE